jgi:chaperone modulatory protein CbpM
MQTEIINIVTWCDSYSIDYSFVDLLEDRGLIRLTVIENDKFIHYDQLPELEQFMRWYYDMDINLEGIETITHLLQKVRTMQNEVSILKARLSLYE